MRSTRVERLIPADRLRIYAAMLDPALLSAWKVPYGMDLEVHEFEPREGGYFRISLTYRDATSAGKSGAHTDTYHGHFVRLIPGELVVDEEEFETDDPALAGQMTSTIRLSDAEGGTLLVATHDNVPPGVSLADNETGWNMSIDRLAELVSGR